MCLACDFAKVANVYSTTPMIALQDYTRTRHYLLRRAYFVTIAAEYPKFKMSFAHVITPEKKPDTIIRQYRVKDRDLSHRHASVTRHMRR